MRETPRFSGCRKCRASYLRAEQYQEECRRLDKRLQEERAHVFRCQYELDQAQDDLKLAQDLLSKKADYFMSESIGDMSTEKLSRELVRRGVDFDTKGARRIWSLSRALRLLDAICPRTGPAAKLHNEIKVELGDALTMGLVRVAEDSLKDTPPPTPPVRTVGGLQDELLAHGVDQDTSRELLRDTFLSEGFPGAPDPILIAALRLWVQSGLPITQCLAEAVIGLTKTNIDLKAQLKKRINETSVPVNLVP